MVDVPANILHLATAGVRVPTAAIMDDVVAAWGEGPAFLGRSQYGSSATAEYPGVAQSLRGHAGSPGTRLASDCLPRARGGDEGGRKFSYLQRRHDVVASRLYMSWWSRRRPGRHSHRSGDAATRAFARDSIWLGQLQGHVGFACASEPCRDTGTACGRQRWSPSGGGPSPHRARPDDRGQPPPPHQGDN